MATVALYNQISAIGTIDIVRDILVLEVAIRGHENIVSIAGEVLVNGNQSGGKIRLVSNMLSPSMWGVRRSDISANATGNRTVIDQFDIIRVTIRRQPPHMHEGDQMENWIWNLSAGWKFIGRLAPGYIPIIYGEDNVIGNIQNVANIINREAFINNPDNLWLFGEDSGANDFVHFIDFDEAKSCPSIYTIRAQNCMFYMSNLKLRVTFSYNGHNYDFRAHDLDWIQSCEEWLKLQNLYQNETEKFPFPEGRVHLLTVSLLLPFKPKGWEYEARFKVVASILAL